MDPMIVRNQIAQLRLLYPELAEDEEAWLLSLESETDFHSFMERVVDGMQEASCMAGAIEGRIAELKNRSDRYVHKDKMLRKLAFNVMAAAGIQKAETPEATLSIRKGSLKVEIPDETAVPDEFCRVVKSPDKTKIKEHLQSCNGNPPNWVALVQGEPSLSVRTK